MGIVSADAEICYEDRIAHIFASLVYQAVGVSISAIMVMLLLIQHMHFFLHTGLGESVGFMTAVIGSIIKGLCQGNTAAPARWLLIAYKRCTTLSVQEVWTWSTFHHSNLPLRVQHSRGVVCRRRGLVHREFSFGNP
jgi:hypothetical protein